MTARRVMISGTAVLLVVLAATSPQVLFGSDDGPAQKLIQKNLCRVPSFLRKPESRFNLKAPDLMWSMARIASQSSHDGLKRRLRRHHAGLA